MRAALLTTCFLCLSASYAYPEFFFDEPFEVHAMEFGTEVSHIDYKEPGLMEEEGDMYGLVFSYTYRGWASEENYSNEQSFDKFMFRVEGKASYGEVDYDSLGTGTAEDIEDYMLEFRGLGGYDFIISNSFTMTPYIGIGYRYLNDDGAGTFTTTGAYGYERISRYIYSPLGMMAAYNFNRHWAIRLTLEYDHFWQGKQTSRFGDVDPFTSTPTNKQHRGYGARSYIELVRKGEKMDFIIAPFVKYWSIKNSELGEITWMGMPLGIGLEPRNTSTEIGAKLAVGF